MPKRHTLSVAACSLALAATCLAGAIPAAASSQPSVTSSFTVPAAPEGSSMPTAAEVEAAKGDKAATDAMISRLESSLAASRDQLEQAETEALQAQDVLLTATEERDARVAEADRAREQVKLAKTYLDQSREAVGNIAADLYRGGASSSTLGILLQDDESNDVFYKAATIDALSQSQSHKLNSAAEAQALVDAWQDYSSAAEKAAKKATEDYDQAASTANSTLNRYESAVDPQRKLRDELIGHLATLQEQEEAEVRKQVEKAEAKADEEKLDSVIAQDTEPKVEDNEQAPTVGQVTPLTVEKPQELAASEPEDSQEQDKPNVAPTPEVETEQAEEEKPQEAAKPTPKPEQSKAPEPEQPKAEKPKATEKREETSKPKADKPKESTKPKTEKPKAEKPKETAKPKPKPQPQPQATPKPTPKPKPKPQPKPQVTEKPKETITPQSSSNYSAAISWAMKTANDPSKYYVFGANGPNAFDCSSFAQRAFAQSGISLPRSSTQQYQAAPQYVSLSQLRPGDLVFSSSNGGASMYHVAIYIGNGQVVHARNPQAGISVTPLSYVNNIMPRAARY